MKEKFVRVSFLEIAAENGAIERREAVGYIVGESEGFLSLRLDRTMPPDGVGGKRERFFLIRRDAIVRQEDLGQSWELAGLV